MAIDFPSSPSIGQQYAYAGVVYTFTDQGTWTQQITTQALDAGTQMLFQQTSAPTGWTKLSAHDDKAIRIVSGSAGSGGSSAFSTVFGKTATDDFTLTVATLASHAHNLAASASGTYASGYYANAGPSYGIPASLVTAVTSAGSSGAHAHGIDLRVAYVDCIVASKN